MDSFHGGYKAIMESKYDAPRKTNMTLENPVFQQEMPQLVILVFREGKCPKQTPTLQEINISHLGKRKIMFKMDFSGDMLVPRRVFCRLESHICSTESLGSWRPPRFFSPWETILNTKKSGSTTNQIYTPQKELSMKGKHLSHEGLK